jgi:uncharacterized membrane protein
MTIPVLLTTLRTRESPSRPRDLPQYVQSPDSYWFWKIVVLSVISLLLVLFIPENVTPWVYFRYVFGAVLLLFLPGYCLVRALFPVKGVRAHPELLDQIERLALSLGASIALTPLTALLLNYSPWGITTSPLIVSLCGLTLSLAVIAVVRERQSQRERTGYVNGV